MKAIGGFVDEKVIQETIAALEAGHVDIFPLTPDETMLIKAIRGISGSGVKHNIAVTINIENTITNVDEIKCRIAEDLLKALKGVRGI